MPPPTLSDEEKQIWLVLLQSDERALTMRALEKALDLEDVALRIALLSLLAKGHLRQRGWKYILQPFGEPHRSP